MAIGDLNVRIGATIKGLQQGLKSAERELKIFANKANSLGDTLTLGLSAPLAGFGALALQAAGDIEQLGLALNSAFANQGRTIQEARRELELLREVAKAPGIDFEQAVQASIRLQSVGLKAEEARQAIVEFGNVISAGGGTADNFGEVVNQLTQIIGKNKILQEDVKILLGNAPALAAVFQDAFGGVTAEQIASTGVTAREFVQKTIEELTKLDRVQGGISNSFVNFRTTLKNALATVGTEINRAFNVQGGVDKFASVIENISIVFKNLSSETIRSTLNFALFALAIGPAIKGVALLASGIIGLIPYVKSFLNLLPIIAGAGAKFIGFLQLATSGSLGFSIAIAKLTAVFAGFNLVAAASVIGAVAIAVTLAANAYKNWRREIEAASAGQRVLSEIQADAVKSIATEKARVTELTAIVRDETKSKRERAAALDKLKAISEEYFGTLDLEKSKTTEIEQATKNYTKAILENARVQAARNKLIEIEGKLLDAQQLGRESDVTLLQAASNAITSLGNPFSLASKNAETFTKNLNNNIKALELQREALLNVIATGEPFTPSEILPTTPKEENKKKQKLDQDFFAVSAEVPIIPTLTSDESLEGIARITEVLKSEFGKIPPEIIAGDQSLKGFLDRVNNELIPALTKTIEVSPATANVFSELGLAFENIDRKAQIFGDTTDVITDKLQLVKTAIENAVTQGSLTNIEALIELYKKLQDQAAKSAKQIGIDMAEVANTVERELEANITEFADALGQYFAGLEKAPRFGRIVLNTLLSVVIEVGKIAIAAGLAVESIKKALESLKGIGAIVAGVALIAVATAARAALNNQAERFAAGGVVTGPTYGLVGEAGPEAIIPLRKLPDIMGFGGAELSARVSGDDLYLIMQRASARKTRIG